MNYSDTLINKRPLGCPFDAYGADESFLEVLNCANCPINPYMCEFKMMVSHDERLASIGIIEYDGVGEIESVMPPSGYVCCDCGDIFPRDAVRMIDSETGESLEYHPDPGGRMGKFICFDCLRKRLGYKVEVMK